MELQKYFSESRRNLFHIHSTHYIAIESSCINVFVVSLAALLNSYLYLLHEWLRTSPFTDWKVMVQCLAPPVVHVEVSLRKTLKPDSLMVKD